MTLQEEEIWTSVRREDRVKTQGEDKPKRERLQKKPTLPTLDLGLLASRTV